MDLTKTGRFKRVAAGKAVTHKRLSNPGMLLRRHTGVAERMRVRARELHVPTGSVSGAARAVAAKLPIARIALVFGLIAFASLGILIGVNAYAQSRQITIRLENGIVPQMITTTARTVRELFSQNNIRLGSKDDVTPALNTRLADGMSVTISRAMIVYVTSMRKMYPLYMTGGTVADALAEAGISYDKDDEITPSVNTKLISGLKIKHVAVESAVVTEYQYIKYTTVYQKTDQLLKGKTQVQQPGHQGTQAKQIKILYKDGVEISRTEISNMITEKPESRIILKGTGVPEKPKPSTSGNTGKTGNSDTGKTGSSGTDKSGDDDGGSSSGGNNGGSSGGDEDSDLDGSNSGRYANVNPEDLVVPAAPSQFESILYMQITAYTHTGSRTSNGGWPQYTRTREKPGTIAVDPKAIPYGTLLYVTGYGYCVAEDTGSNTADSSRMGDVFMNTKEECNRWGRQRNVTVYVVQSDFKR